MPDQIMSESETNVIPLKKDSLDAKQVLLWRNRFKTANKYHRQKISEKYKTAKRRYNAESFGFEKNKKVWTHQTFNFLYKDIEDFNGATYFKNPQIDLTCRNTQDPVQVRNIENLEQDTNDDIKDNQSLKAMIRAGLVDESLAGLGAFYIDYDYKTQDSEEQIGEDAEGEPIFSQKELSNKVRPIKILPENLIYPPFQTLYNYQEALYLGFVDISTVECLKSDNTLNQDVVSKIKGKSYLELSEIDKEQLKSDGVDLKDDMLYAKIYYGWIKGDDGGLLKRVVLSDEGSIKEPLAYEDWDRGNGPDGKGYPIHILALNDACEGFIPPSEAWILESILCIIDYLMTKMMRHLKRSKTRTMIKGGLQGVKKENIEKFLSSEDLEVLALNNLPVGLDIRSLVLQLEDQPLSTDHGAMFELCKRVFDELSRKPSFGQTSVIEQKKTATEAEAIDQQDKSQGAYKVDKFRDFQVSFFYDWAKLKQKNYKGTKNITVNNGETGEEEHREIIASENRNDFEGEFNPPDISIESFTAPNKALKRRMIKETIMDLQSMIPLLGGKKRINGERAMMDMLQNVDVRNPDEYLIDVPVRTVDQQLTDLAFKQMPMNVEDVGTDYQGAIQRLLAILGDHELIAKMKPLIPDIGLPEGPIANMALDLEAMIQQSQEKGKQSSAQSDMSLNTASLAQGQK